jgi:hypothetical protein
MGTLDWSKASLCDGAERAEEEAALALCMYIALEGMWLTLALRCSTTDASDGDPYRETGDPLRESEAEGATLWCIETFGCGGELEIELLTTL